MRAKPCIQLCGPEPIALRHVERQAKDSIMANAPSTQGRNQDGAKATESQHREVKHEATGSGKVEVKKTVKTVGISYERVEK